MFLAKPSFSSHAEPANQLGTVTLAGDPAGVYFGGERRWIPLYSPGGYHWKPREGEQALVIRSGQQGESPCLIGCAQSNLDLQPGEVSIQGGQGSLFFSEEGVKLFGSLSINGEPLEQLILRLVAPLLPSGGDAL